MFNQIQLCVCVRHAACVVLLYISIYPISAWAALRCGVLRYHTESHVPWRENGTESSSITKHISRHYYISVAMEHANARRNVDWGAYALADRAAKINRMWLSDLFAEYFVFFFHFFCAPRRVAVAAGGAAAFIPKRTGAPAKALHLSQCHCISISIFIFVTIFHYKTIKIEINYVCT